MLRLVDYFHLTTTHNKTQLRNRKLEETKITLSSSTTTKDDSQFDLFESMLRHTDLKEKTHFDNTVLFPPCLLFITFALFLHNSIYLTHSHVSMLC